MKHDGLVAEVVTTAGDDTMAAAVKVPVVEFDGMVEVAGLVVSSQVSHADVPRCRAQCWFPHGIRNVWDFDLNRTVTMRSLSMSLVHFLAVLGLPSHHGGHRLQH